MSQLAVSGIAVDTLFFSRIGVPLFHRYRVFNRLGTHGAFRGTYMRRMHAFLEESDAVSLRRHHRRCARDIAARMSQISLRATETVWPYRSEANTIQALMDLALPRFEGLGDGPPHVHRPWMVSTNSAASPDLVCSTDLLRLPSPCLNLDALTSDDTEDSVKLSNISVTLICGSDDGHTPVNSDQVLSDEDLPAAAGSDDRIQVIRIRHVSPNVQIVDIFKLVGIGIPDGQCGVWGTQRIARPRL